MNGEPREKHYPTDPFTILEVQNQSIAELYLAEKHQSADLKAIK